MNTTSSPHNARDLGLLLLRLCAGGFLLPHGLGKLFGTFGGPGLRGFGAELQSFGLPSTAPMPLLLAAVQALAGLLVALGLYARASAFVAAGFLAATVALSVANGWFWMHGGVEYPLMWTAVMLAIALMGAGTYSIDAARHRYFRPATLRTPL